MDFGFQLPKFLLVALALFAGMRVEGAALAHVAALFISSIVLLILLKPLSPTRSEAPQPIYRMREIWSQSLPVYLTRLLRTFGGRMELLVLGFFGLGFDVGIYAAVLQISMLGNLLPEALITVSMPLISGAHYRNRPEAIRALLHNITRWCLTAVLPYYVAVALFSQTLLGAFGKEFVGGQTILLLLAALPLMNSTGGVAAAALTMTGKARINSFNSLTYLVTTITLDLLLIPQFGIKGAAVAAFSSTLLLNILRVGQVRWIFGIWPVDRQVFKPVVAAGLAAVGALVVREALSGTQPWILLGLGLATMGTIYFTLLYVLGISQADRVVLDAVGRRVPAVRRMLNGSSQDT
jgi:O-antigen/teichoic acid export membrane protein